MRHATWAAQEERWRLLNQLVGTTAAALALRHIHAHALDSIAPRHNHSQYTDRLQAEEWQAAAAEEQQRRKRQRWSVRSHSPPLSLLDLRTHAMRIARACNMHRAVAITRHLLAPVGKVAGVSDGHAQSRAASGTAATDSLQAPDAAVASAGRCAVRRRLEPATPAQPYSLPVAEREKLAAQVLAQETTAPRAAHARPWRDFLLASPPLLSSLPGETARLDERGVPISRNTPNVAYSLVRPTPLNSEPHVAALNPAAFHALQIEPPRNAEELRSFARMFGGCDSSIRGWSLRYGGHQFGFFVGQLGDGRAISLGQTIVPSSSSSESDPQRLRQEQALWEVQLKGCGPTPYARGFDGRSTLSSSIREYLASIHLRGLGIPVTDALALVCSDDPIRRVGVPPTLDTAAVLTRLAPGFWRIGNVQMHVVAGETQLAKQLLDYIIRTHFSHIPLPSSPTAASSSEHSNPYLLFLREVVCRNARLVARWQAAGFVHGVLNTDNVSLLGLTLDLGPFGFQEAFDPDWTPNSSDDSARYTFAQQARAIRWGLERLAEDLLALQLGLSWKQCAAEVVDGFEEEFASEYLRLMRAKLGLHVDACNDGAEDAHAKADRTLVQDLLALMERCGADYSLFFRNVLGNLPSARPPQQQSQNPASSLHPSDAASIWSVLHPWRRRGMECADELAGVKVPSDPDRSLSWSDWLARYRARLTQQRQESGEQRWQRMKRANPKWILRAWVAEEITRAAMERPPNFRLLHAAQTVFASPFDEHENGVAPQEWAQMPPEWASHVTVSCAS